MHSKSEDCREIVSFVERVLGASGRLPERVGTIRNAFRMGITLCVFEGIHFARKIREIPDFASRWVIANVLVRAQKEEFGMEEGSTSHPAR